MPPSNRRATFQPAGWHTVTPRLIAVDAAGLVTFLRKAFGAHGHYRADAPTEVWIGDSVVMVSDAGAHAPATAFLYIYVEDADATYARALEAGATHIEPPLDTPYGDRRATIGDAWGNRWQIATRVREPGLQAGGIVDVSTA